MKLSHLLVPIAPEQPLNDYFHQAFEFANNCSAKVTLLTVIKDFNELREVSRHSCSTLDLLDKATEVYHDALTNHIKQIQQQYPNIQFDTKVRVGIPSIEIIKEAEESSVSMVVIDSHRKERSVVCKRGSNTLNLMRKSEVPIWSVSSTTDSIAKVSRVVAAIDLANQEYQAFNEKIVSLAVEYCSIMGAELTLSHVWRLESEGFLRKWSGYSDVDISLLAAKMREERIERLKSLLLPYENSAVPTQIKVLEGEARVMLPTYIANSNASLVVLGSLSRSGIAGFLMGNTAESMVNKLDCSVITLKPDSFKSPILME
ncbi:universal stress protein [Photobacterium sanctipauli]|uniref:Universal stress protein n=1 Tax=Photobacterium sanctipauli TaxID=1342794 RepID=A0A2T3P116_9GAMM|nr:universal stress protein [Photobacterium sanctipauli]PSW22216.1 universal stress protein [Photobacterium sanctipauli]